MYKVVLDLHSVWAYLLLAVLVIAVINSFIGFSGKKVFSEKKDLRIALFGLITMHIQLLLGLLLYFVSPNGVGLFSAHGGGVMKDSLMRLHAVEHPLMMILAVVFITIGFSKHKKKNEDAAKFKTLAIFYSLALVFVLSRIPWAQWL